VNLERLKLNFVQYDGDPNRYVEPVNHLAFYDSELAGFNSVNTLLDGQVVSGIETYEGQPMVGVTEFL